MSSWKESGYKMLVAGAVGTLGAYVLGERSTYPLYGMQMPSSTIVGGAAAVGTGVADLAHTYILPHIPGNEKFATLESAGLGLGVSGGGTMLGLKMAGAQNGLMMGGLIGAGSFVAADYTASKMFSQGPSMSIFG